MNITRLNKQIFTWSRNKSSSKCKNAIFYIQRFLKQINMQVPQPNNEVNLKKRACLSAADMKLLEYCTNRWKNEWNRVSARRGPGNNKLRTYQKIKYAFEVEPYVHIVLSNYYRSALARFRAGVAPIRMDTGRFEHSYTSEDQRICLLCQTELESEKQVILSYPAYEDLRRELFIKVFSINSDFYEMSSDAKLCFIISDKHSKIHCQDPKLYFKPQTKKCF